MHYFTKNIGDYAKKTGRLSMLEHGAYTLLLDAYYDRERPPTKREAIAWVWARSDEEIAAVGFVLERFFCLDGDVYRQKRVDEEIEKYKEKSRTNKRIAEEREAKRKLSKDTNRERSVNEALTKRHLTNNHKPITKKENGGKSPNFSPPDFEAVKEYCDERNNGIDAGRFVDWYQVRGWMVGKNKMKDWKAAVRTWEKPKFDAASSSSPSGTCNLCEELGKCPGKTVKSPACEKYKGGVSM